MIFALIKSLLLNNDTRNDLYRAETGLPLSPVPVITRWGTPITSVKFLPENFVKLENFINSLEFDGNSNGEKN